jgi:hypothetical protein
LKLGNRKDWWNEVADLKFSVSDDSTIKTYIEVCCQYGREKQLIVNLIIQGKQDVDEKDLESAFEAKEKVFEKANKGTLIQWPSKPETSAYRIKVKLAAELLTEIEGVKDIKDPKLYALGRESHFSWFQSILKEVEKVFSTELV